MLDRSSWLTGLRLIVRKERPHPGARLRFTDPSGHRVEISDNQEAGYNALFDPVCDLEALKNMYKDGEELWEDNHG